jgi:ABC-type branched-subunit amino acid transport system ATPase component/branched-subunit amino acid ABC-type transport system permease component
MASSGLFMPWGCRQPCRQIPRGSTLAEFLVFVIAGLTAGAVYSLAGVGLVLTYRTSGIFNFAHGALATVSAYVFYTLHIEHSMPWLPAAAIAVGVLGPAMGLVLELLARRLQRSPFALQVAATVGLMLVVAAAVTLIYGNLTVRTVPVFLGSGSFRVAGTDVQWSDAITMLVGVVATALLWVLLRATRIGMAMRAVVDDRDLLDSAGINPARVQRIAWMIGSSFAAASGVLFAPLLPLDPIQLTLLVIAAYGAAAVGAFRSLPLTFVGGLLIGVLASLATRYLTSGLLLGVSPSMPFIVLFVVLLVFPKSKLPRGTGNLIRTSSTWSAPSAVTIGSGVLLLGLFVAAPSFAGLHLTDWLTALTTTILFLSLSLLVRTSGQVSLAHVTFAAIGAAGFSHLAVDHHVPWPLALILAGLIAVPVGAVLAIPAIRLSGLYLALATFGLGILVQYMFYTQSYMFGANGVGLTEPRPHLSWISLDSDKGFYYLVLAIALASVALLVAIGRSRLGRLLRGVAEAPVALETSGASINVTRVLVFCLSAFLAAVAGALTGAAQGTVTADSYQPMKSLVLLTVIVVIGLGAPWNAVIASIALVLVPSYLTGTNVPLQVQLVFGACAVMLALLPERRRHLPSAVTGWIDRRFARPAGSRSRFEAVATLRTTTTHPARIAAGEAVLEVRGLSVAFGGVQAVDDVSLVARSGEITGLIGPNGAGKTTTFNACSGLVKRSRGQILVHGRDVSRLGPSRRARAGIGRTFQQMQLFEALSVRDNVALGAEGSFADHNPLAHLASRPGHNESIADRTSTAMALCEIADLADIPVTQLSTGQRRLVDLARCLAGERQILLLDEPSSGLDHVETTRFAAVLRRVVAEHGVGIVLVEHDLGLVLDLCASIYVLDFGKLLFAGSPAEVVASPVVQAAYLGDSASLEQQLHGEGRLVEATS